MLGLLPGADRLAKSDLTRPAHRQLSSGPGRLTPHLAAAKPRLQAALLAIARLPTAPPGGYPQLLMPSLVRTAVRSLLAEQRRRRQPERRHKRPVQQAAWITPTEDILLAELEHLVVVP